MSQIDQDNALGANDEFNDQQGVFTGGARPAVAPAKSGGGGAAKLLIGVFGAGLLGIMGWVGVKLMNRGSAEVENTLAAPIQADAGVPMAQGMADPQLGPAPEAVAPAAAPAVPAVGTIDASNPGAVIQAPAMPVGADLAAGQPAPATPAAAPTAAPTQPIAPVAAPAQPAPAVAQQPAAAPQPTPAATAPVAAPVAAAPVDVQKLQDENRALKKEVARLQRLAACGGSSSCESAGRTRPARKSQGRAAARPTRAVAEAPAAAPAPAPKMDSLTLKAVLEGRAWVQLKSGETVTVAPGDEVGGVTVTSIDAERGTVRMSNGAVLR